MRLKRIYIEQLDSNDCAAACLAMVCKYYGKDYSITKLRDVLGTDIKGTPINGLHHGAEKLGFDVKKVRITKDVIKENFTLPAICHVRTEEGLSHFVVLFKNNKGKLTVLDPAQGIIKYSLDDFFNIFDGIILLMYPNNQFKKSKEGSESIFKNFVQLVKPQKKLFSYAILASIFLTILSLFFALFNKVLMDEIIPYNLQNLLVKFTIGFALVLIVKVILNAVRQHLVLYLSQKIDLPLMLGYFQHIFKLPINFFASRKIGDITTRFQDAYIIKNILTNTALTVIIDIILAVVSAIIMIIMCWKLFMVILVVTILSAILIFVFKGPYKKINKKQMEQGAKLNANIIESLKGIETIKTNAYEKPTMDKVENEYVKTLKISFSEGIYSNVQNSFSSVISGLGNLILMAFGAYLIMEGENTIGTLLAFLSIANYFIDPIGRLINLQLSIQEASISLKRLNEIYEVSEEEEEEIMNPYIDNVYGDIEFRNVMFKYGSRSPVIDNLSLTIPKGKKVALVGESGSGKTTLSKLLLKLYKVNEGEIYINGLDINNINAYSLREKIGYVPQNIEMFSGSIIDNIRVGKSDATEEEIRNICEYIGCNKFINKMPFDYNTFLDESGGGLSGGEKQRLAMARAIVKRPKFIILDEATSNLDFITEKQIFDTIFKKEKDTTVLIIAHRLSTIRKCDLIYVLDKGKVSEKGTHKDLLEKKGLYYKLWISQVGDDNDTQIPNVDEEQGDEKTTENTNDIGGDIIEYK
jgi:ATP-binding cassette subfamily B protein